MNLRFTLVETSLNRAEFRWKWLKFLRYTFALGTVLCIGTFLSGLAMVSGALSDKSLVLTLAVVLCVGGLLAWIVIMIMIAAAAGGPDRIKLAAALERVEPRLQDRVNTLVSLEPRKGRAHEESFALRIAKQAQVILAQQKSPPTFPRSGTFPQFLAFIIALTVTAFFYEHCSPWTHLLASQKTVPSRPGNQDKPLELAAPQTNNAEQDQGWGEVRITDPGADLKVTKVDVVPLQIEAAANSRLKNVGWYSTINGAQETPHELPPPSEPRYGVFQPTIYLDELQLSDWDVMTYYAKASAEKQNSFASEVYFLEVRPFREDLLKLPGGENGAVYQTLNDLSGLIDRQQHIVRETHRHVQRPPEQENLQAQDRKKLSEAEGELGESTQHLYAKMATEMENKPIGEALDNLAKAEKSLAQASELLEDNVMSPAQERERGALSELIAASKMFQKSVSEHANDFADLKNQEPVPTADTRKKLSEIAEFRNESKAARDFVEKTLEQQRNLEQQAGMASRSRYGRLADQQQQLEQNLAEFQSQHPQVFKGTEAESQQAHQAMDGASDSLQQRSANAPAATRLARQRLEEFNDAMQNRSAVQQLANAYKLKQMLDHQIHTFDEASKPDTKIPAMDLQQTADAAHDTLNQLKRTAEQEPTRDAFGPKLRDSLSGSNKVNLDAKLTQLAQAQDDPMRQQKSAEVKEGLAQVSKAFGESQPASLQQAQKNGSLQGNDQDSFGLGMAELESLLRQLEQNRPISGAAKGKQAQQALFNLQTGMRSQFGGNERGEQLLLHLKQMLKSENPVDIGDLKKLMEQLEHFSAETADQLAKKEDKPDLTNIDPSRLPPAYRGRIQKYFEKLSEK